MSDGPHKTLPMRQHWKAVSQLAANSTFALDDVADAFQIALKRDFRNVPLSEVRDIFGGCEQTSLFQEDRQSHLEAARRTCRGSVAGNALIDCAQEANALGLTGDEAMKFALANAIDANAHASFHQIEEHWCRNDPQSTPSLLERLRKAHNHCSLPDLCNELINGNNVGVRALKMPKRSGVDEGPMI